MNKKITKRVESQLCGQTNIRSTFVLNPESQVIYEERWVKISGHAEKILNFIKQQFS